jgi:hypothetical protein
MASKYKLKSKYILTKEEIYYILEDTTCINKWLELGGIFGIVNYETIEHEGFIFSSAYYGNIDVCISSISSFYISDKYNIPILDYKKQYGQYPVNISMYCDILYENIKIPIKIDESELIDDIIKKMTITTLKKWMEGGSYFGIMDYDTINYEGIICIDYTGEMVKISQISLSFIPEKQNHPIISYISKYKKTNNIFIWIGHISKEVKKIIERQLKYAEVLYQ